MPLNDDQFLRTINYFGAGSYNVVRQPMDKK
jgi:hypothetical protein